jgi:hypothetical protein
MKEVKVKSNELLDVYLICSDTCFAPYFPRFESGEKIGHFSKSLF